VNRPWGSMAVVVDGRVVTWEPMLNDGSRYADYLRTGIYPLPEGLTERCPAVAPHFGRPIVCVRGR